jgi:uncharacterized protein (TIGR03067 family)
VCVGLRWGWSAAAPALKNRPAASVGGEWVAERAILGGADVTRAVGPFRYTFGDDGDWVYAPSNDSPSAGRYKYAADTKLGLAAIDLVADAGGPDRRTLRGICRVAGDTLTLCYPNDPVSARPDRFESTAGTEVYLISFRRATPKH